MNITPINFTKNYSPKINISPLPNEMLFEILKFLPAKTNLLNVQLTCKNFHEITNKRYFWILKIQKYNPNLTEIELNNIQNPKDLVIKNYKCTKVLNDTLNDSYSHLLLFFPFGDEIPSFLTVLLEKSEKCISFFNFAMAKKTLDFCVENKNIYSKKCSDVKGIYYQIISQYLKIRELETVLKLLGISESSNTKLCEYKDFSSPLQNSILKNIVKTLEKLSALSEKHLKSPIEKSLDFIFNHSIEKLKANVPDNEKKSFLDIFLNATELTEKFKIFPKNIKKIENTKESIIIKEFFTAYFLPKNKQTPP